jgi:hypothetical protein
MLRALSIVFKVGKPEKEKKKSEERRTLHADTL